MSVSGKEAIKANSTNKKNVEVSLALDNTGNITLTQSDSGLKATVDTGVMSVATGSTNGTIAVDGSEVAVAGLGSAAYTDASDYKTKQTVVSDPTADGSATAFIDSISQNANGEIVVTKKNITAADLGLSGAMHFKGVKTTLPDVADYNEGDVVIVGGKEYVLALNGEGNAKTWNELGDEGSHALKTITITGTDGLTGGGSLEANRTIGIATSGVTTTKIADKNVTKDKLSDEVQASLAKADSALQEHQSLAHLKAKQTAVTNKITDAAHVLTSLTQNENGDISYDVKTLTPADIGAQVAGDYALKSELPTVNDGKLTVSTEAGVLTGSGEFTANQVGDTSISIGIADKGINTAKIDDQAVGAAQTKAYQTATPTKDNPNSEEIWVFYCGTSDILV